MSDAKFSFQERGRVYRPAWMSPEALQKSRLVRNAEACDMWSFAVCLWELATREVPFADLSPMECGMLKWLKNDYNSVLANIDYILFNEIGLRIATEGLRLDIPPGASSYLAKLIKICMNEDPGKRPKFDMVVPILDKMKR